MDDEVPEIDVHDGVLTATVNLPERSASDHTEPTLDASLIVDALSQLNPEQRTVIVRAYYRGESIAALADALDVPQCTVKSRLHHGLRALRLALQDLLRPDVTGQAHTLDPRTISSGVKSTCWCWCCSSHHGEARHE